MFSARLYAGMVVHAAEQGSEYKRGRAWQRTAAGGAALTLRVWRARQREKREAGGMVREARWGEATVVVARSLSDSRRPTAWLTTRRRRRSPEEFDIPSSSALVGRQQVWVAVRSGR